eukprot:scaffold596198_cov15-Prasinocladus_malaysianus.AAC.1
MLLKIAHYECIQCDIPQWPLVALLRFEYIVLLRGFGLVTAYAANLGNGIGQIACGLVAGTQGMDVWSPCRSVLSADVVGGLSKNTKSSALYQEQLLYIFGDIATLADVLDAMPTHPHWCLVPYQGYPIAPDNET